MPNLGRLCVALAVPLVLPAAAEAQTSRSALVAPVEAGSIIVPARSGLPDFRMPPGDLRAPPGPARNGLIGTIPLRRDLQIAIGRFAVPELAGPRTNIESERRSAEVRRRDRGIAAVGFSLRF